MPGITNSANLLLLIASFAVAGCDRAAEVETRAVDTIVNPRGKRTVRLHFPEPLRGKDAWYFLTNQHGGTDFCGAFSVPDSEEPLLLEVNGEDRSVTARAERVFQEGSFLGRSTDVAAYPYFAYRSAGDEVTDFRSFSVYFASSEPALNDALNGKFIPYPELGEDRFVVITLKEPREVFPKEFSQMTGDPTELGKSVGAEVN